jgi:cytochrome P450 family 13
MMIDHEDISKSESVTREEKQKPDGQWKPLKKSLTNMEILSQAFLFIIAGSDTTALTMTYVTYLLAKNPEIQAKLYNEIEKAFNEHVTSRNKKSLL